MIAEKLVLQALGLVKAFKNTESKVSKTEGVLDGLNFCGVKSRNKVVRITDRFKSLIKPNCSSFFLCEMRF